MKKVVFVAGAPYSGTTVLDLMLGNDPVGFSCGELADYLKPIKWFHAREMCGCGNSKCTFWKEVKTLKQASPYPAIFEKKPEVNFVVDSSKHPPWIARQAILLERQNIATRRVLIWKSPLEIAQSFAKRGLEDQWVKTWINYHKFFFSVSQEAHFVAYSDLINDKSVLPRLCNALDISFFEGKELYWEKSHHVLGGNQSARVHLYDKDTNLFAHSNSIIQKDTGRAVDHRAVKKDDAIDSGLKSRVDQQVLEQPEIRKILKFLEASRSESHCSLVVVPSDLKMPFVSKQARIARSKAREILGTIRFT